MVKVTFSPCVHHLETRTTLYSNRSVHSLPVSLCTLIEWWNQVGIIVLTALLSQYRRAKSHVGAKRIILLDRIPTTNVTARIRLESDRCNCQVWKHLHPALPLVHLLIIVSYLFTALLWFALTVLERAKHDVFVGALLAFKINRALWSLMVQVHWTHGLAHCARNVTTESFSACLNCLGGRGLSCLCNLFDLNSRCLLLYARGTLGPDVNILWITGLSTHHGQLASTFIDVLNVATRISLLAVHDLAEV